MSEPIEPGFITAMITGAGGLIAGALAHLYRLVSRLGEKTQQDIATTAEKARHDDAALWRAIGDAQGANAEFRERIAREMITKADLHSFEIRLFRALEAVTPVKTHRSPE